ncbi:MAG TPA: glycosyltransferase family 4 protein [Solirubrobacteraceae bacterium]|nr:glycosyltransferase family 4 protein [Solirubrobacteraceae bacterium]
MLLTPVWGRDGGVATHVKASAAALARHGLEVHVLAAHVYPSEPIAGVTVHERPGLLKRGTRAAARLGGSTRPRAAVVHLHQLDDPAVVKLTSRSAPVVISAHTYPGCTSGVHYFAPGQECARAHGPGCIPNLLARGCAHTRHPKTLPLKYWNVTRGLAALRLADMVVSHSRTIDRHLASNGLARRAIVPLFPTIPMPAGSPAPAARRVLFAGRLEAPKGVAVLIHAVRELDCELVICGGGRLLEQLRGLTARLAIEDRVRFAGWLEPPELAGELAQASVVAIPSLWPEPFGLVGIEALAVGRPVVASATGGIRDWLADDVGVGVKPGDARELALALERLLSDRDGQLAMGAAGKRLVASRFSAERHVETLLGAYHAARSRWSAARAPGATAARPTTSAG